MFELTLGRVTPVSIYGQATGRIGATIVSNAVGNVHVSWTWSDGATPITELTLDAKSNLCAGTYRLTVRDDASSTASNNYNVTQNKALRIYPGAITNVEIFGQATGAIARTVVSGGDGVYTPYWSSERLNMTQDHSLQAKSNLYAGDYTVRVVDGAGAFSVYTYTVQQTHQLQIRGGKSKNASIGGLTAGSIAQCKVTGGIPPLLYMWNSSLGATEIMTQIPLDAYNEYTIPENNELKVGQYTLTVSDSMGAVARQIFTIREGPNRLYHAFGASSNFQNNND